MLFLTIGCFTPLLGVWILEYGFDYWPCRLCIWQRYPYIVSIGILLLYWLIYWRPTVIAVKHYDIGKSIKSACLVGVYICMSMSVILCTHHILIEFGLLPSPRCVTLKPINSFADFEAYMAYYEAQKIVSCAMTKPLFGISLVVWNMIISIFLWSLCYHKIIKSIKKKKKRTEPSL